MNSVRLVSENGVSNIQKKLWYVDNSSEINLDNFEAGDRIYSINDNKLFQIEYDTSSEQEYSGEIVSFEADEDDRISSLEVEINPVQDLHGYDNPWPAGGGVNQFDPSDATPVSTGRAYNLTVSVDEAEETITASGSASWPASGGSFSFALVDVTKNYTGLVGNVFVVSKSSNVTSINSVSYSNGAIVINATVTANGTTSIVLKISFASTSQTAWTPYANECPISGWTGLNLSHSGADTSNPTVIPISWQDSAGTVYGGQVQINENGSVTLTVVEEIATITSVVAADPKYSRVTIGAKGYLDESKNSISNILSRYSGEIINMPVNSYMLINSDAFNAAQVNIRLVETQSTPTAMRDACNAILSEWNNAGTPLQIIIPLSSPVVYNLDSIDQITTILGTNNIWANTGDIIAKIAEKGITAFELKPYI